MGCSEHASGNTTSAGSRNCKRPLGLYSCWEYHNLGALHIQMPRNMNGSNLFWPDCDWPEGGITA